ncbi:MAG: hypothetical protein J6J97_01265 [Akkermansia sp.]|nr:hypothetical protein [Akkermansia sp.]MBQ8376761.1 hypothetical protein [Akkermansia sp.]
MPIVIFIIAIVVGSLIHSWLDNYAKEKHADEACAYYISLVKLDKEELNGNTLDVPESVLTYAKDYLPLLYPKWEQIRSNYKRISGEINLMETRYNNLVKLNNLNKNKIKTERPKAYQAWLDKQNKELADFKKAHEQIKQSVEKYYAEAQIRGIDSDAEMQSMVGGLIETTNVVLGEYGYEVKDVPASEPAKEAHKQSEKKKKNQENEKPAAKSSSAFATTKQKQASSNNASPSPAKTKKAKQKGSENKCSSAREKEIKAYMTMVNSFNRKLGQLAELLNSIHSPNDARRLEGQLNSLANELIELKEQCKTFPFRHVKNFEAEVVAHESSTFSSIGSTTQRVASAFPLMEQSRWLSRNTLKNIELLLKK